MFRVSDCGSAAAPLAATLYFKASIPLFGKMDLGYLTPTTTTSLSRAAFVVFKGEAVTVLQAKVKTQVHSLDPPWALSLVHPKAKPLDAFLEAILVLLCIKGWAGGQGQYKGFKYVPHPTHLKTQASLFPPAL